ncbi:MAG: glycosyltransferase [Ferruginibacter sp.]
MFILFAITLLLIIVYAALIIYYRQCWLSIPEFVQTVIIPSVKITVIIPARNEQENIKACLDSILNQSYSKNLLK